MSFLALPQPAPEGGGMYDRMKKIGNEALEKVDGGAATAFAELREEFKKMIPADVQEKANAAVGDEAVRRVLAENGIDVEKIEKKIARTGFNPARINLQELPDEALDKIAGGFETGGVEIKCPCGVHDRSCFSYQVIDTLMSTDIVDSVYRCNNCGMYITVLKDGRVQYYKD